MNKTIKFVKENNGLWFADLPEWTGDKGDLQMVCGADTLLEIIGQGDQIVSVYFNTEPFEGASVLALMGLGLDGDLSLGGGSYILDNYMGIHYSLNVWLCDVTNFVFGEMPMFIYFCNASI